VPESTDPSTFFRSTPWQHRYDEEILLAARSFVSKVRDMRMEESGPHCWLLAATVAGEDTQITFWQDPRAWESETRCSCEVGAFCHHAAALAMRASKERDVSRLLGHNVRTAVDLELSRSIPQASAPPANLPTWNPKPTFELHVVREPVDRQLSLLLQSLGQPVTEQWIIAEAIANYDGHRCPLRASEPAWTSEVTRPDGSRVILQHDQASETRAARQLAETGLSSMESNAAWRFLLNRKSRSRNASFRDRWFPDPARIPVDAFWHQFRGEMLHKLTSQGWNVTIADNVGHRVFDAEPASWDSGIHDVGGGWFSLSVGFDVGGTRYDLLPILAKLLESDLLEETLHHPDAGYIYAPLPNGDALRLPIGRVRRILHHLASLVDRKFPSRTKLHVLDVAASGLLGDLGIAPTPDMQRLADNIRNFSGMAAVPVPPDLHATLRDYQLAGFHWMQFLARHGLHGILADDMGLGKTLQTLTHILAEKHSGITQGLPALVIAPTSVVPNWIAEARKFTPSLRLLELTGPERRKYHTSIPYADLILTSYALLHRDIDRLRQHKFHLAVLDEAQNIKNPHALVAQAACKLDARHRICLSGTPVENHLGELWSLMKFLIPGFLGSEQAFSDAYRKPIEKDGDPQRAQDLKQRVAPLILRRTKDQVAKELPPKTELVHLIELHSAQKDLYETVRATMNKRVREAIAARGMDGIQMVFLEALLKLRQICCDPRLLPDDFAQSCGESAKLDFLTELLAVLIEEGRRILIFSQFTTMLALIEDHLIRQGIAYLKLTGSSKDRGKLVEDFQTGKIPLFLISLKAGGTGLNLTAADTVIHYDPWWNPAAEAQATDRAYRIGQKKPVFVHKLLCQDTVEQRIHQLQQQKAKLAAGLLADADISQRLNPEMLRSLLD